tara:strand:- start:3626 stop:3823 length:198 start_codon:yes stop_codon:yes gene_type:complete
MAQGDKIFYKMKNAKLIPDTYGMTIEVKMLSAHKGDGSFVKNLKLNDAALKIIKEGWIVYNNKEK